METITINGQSYEVIVTEHEFFEDDKYTVYLTDYNAAVVIIPITEDNQDICFYGILDIVYRGDDGREHVIGYADLPPVCQDKLEEWIKENVK